MKAIKVLLVISGLLAVGVSLALIFAAAAFLAPEGIIADDKVAVVAQAQGGLLFAIGVVNLLALRVRDPLGLQAVCGGNLAAHLTGLAVNVHALSAHLVSQQIMGDVVGHVVFGLAFAAAIVALRKQQPAAT